MQKFAIVWKSSDPQDLEKLKKTLLDHDRTVLSTASAPMHESLVLLKNGYVLSHRPEEPKVQRQPTG